MATQTKINVWQEGGEWFFAAWLDGQYDDNARLCDGGKSEAEAVEVARERFGEDAEINVVEQTT